MASCFGFSAGGANRAADEPMHTITASVKDTNQLVAAHLQAYYGKGNGGEDRSAPADEALRTITTKDRFGLVMVQGEAYQIVDIGMRMLSPRELFRAQGFPDSYIIDPLFNGKPLSKTSQVAKCGNSVSPVMARALVHANISTKQSEDVGAAA